MSGCCEARLWVTTSKSEQEAVLSEFLDTVNEYVWSNALVYLCLAAGVYFSIRSRFVQVRQVPEMIRLMLRGEKSPSGVSSFQALTMSLAGRVGTGNIAGVSTAIAFGGPGALFWMWAVAFLGASTSFVECTLGQIYKTRDTLTGEYRGGPAYYLSRAIRAHPGRAGVQGVRLHLRRGDGAGVWAPAAQRAVEFDGVGDELGLGMSQVVGGDRHRDRAGFRHHRRRQADRGVRLDRGAVHGGGLHRAGAGHRRDNASLVPEVLSMIFASAFGFDVGVRSDHRIGRDVGRQTRHLLQ